jgi:AGZA family xanthine/uracil permease-like MFS transporter
MGSVVAVGEQAGFVDENGRVPEIKRILAVDSLAAATGGLFGASSITTYIESAAGVAQGGRSGLTVVVTGILFAMSSFLLPIIRMIGGGYRITNESQYANFVHSGFKAPLDTIPPTGTGDYFVFPITAGALIIVGFLMMKTVRDISWEHKELAFPAFITIVTIPLTYNISHGIGLGFISYCLIMLMQGKGKEVAPLMYVASFAFLLAFLLPLLGIAT